MSYVITAPEALAAAASDIAGIGSIVDTANATAGSTTRVAAMATDEVSAAIAALFGTHAQEYQAVSAQVANFHAQFVKTLAAARVGMRAPRRPAHRLCSASRVR